jgi:hypothetical protein
MLLQNPYQKKIHILFTEIKVYRKFEQKLSIKYIFPLLNTISPNIYHWCSRFIIMEPVLVYYYQIKFTFILRFKKFLYCWITIKSAVM